MDDSPSTPPGLMARLASDPVQLRRRSWIALLVLLALVGASRFLGDGNLLMALTWVFAPLVAFGIGVGDAFFVRYGRGTRRIALTILVSIFTALTSCVILAFISDSSTSRLREVVEAMLYAALYAGIVLGLAGLIAFGIGRGEDYVSRRIERMSDEDW